MAATAVRSSSRECCKSILLIGKRHSTDVFSSKGIAPHIEVKQTKIQEFMELDDAFVSNVVGVESLESQNKSKL